MLLIQLQKLVDKIFTIGFGKLRPNIRADGFSEHFNFLVSEADNLNTVVLHQLQIFLVLILCVVYAVGALLTANTKYLRINLPESSTCPETNTTAEWGLW